MPFLINVRLLRETLFNELFFFFPVSSVEVLLPLVAKLMLLLLLLTKIHGQLFMIFSPVTLRHDVTRKRGLHFRNKNEFQ